MVRRPYLCGLVVSKSSDKLLSRAAIGGMGGMSVGQRGGGKGGEGTVGRRRGQGEGGLGLQAVKGVFPRGQHNSHPGKEPAPELILVKQIHKNCSATGPSFIKPITSLQYYLSLTHCVKNRPAMHFRCRGVESCFLDIPKMCCAMSGGITSIV